MTRTLTPWTRFPRTFAELETEFPKWMTEMFTPEGTFGKFEFVPEVNVAETEKAVEVTASAVRGTMGAEGSQSPSFVGDLFREVYKALKEAADAIPKPEQKAGF